VSDLFRDVVLSLRRLRAAPAFTAFSIITLAVGIGMTTAIHGLIHGSLLRPPHIRAIDEVVNIYGGNLAAGFASGRSLALSMPDIQDLSSSHTSFEQLAAWRRARVSMSARGTSELMFAEAVTGSYFPLVGAVPLLGRLLQPADDNLSAAPVVVISESYWRRRFDADSEIVGRVVGVNGHRVEIAGVVAAPFQGVDMPNLVPTTLWLPAHVADFVDRSTGADRLRDRDARAWFLKARLRDGVTLAHAAAEVAAIGRQLDEAYPIPLSPEDGGLRRVDKERRWHTMRADGVHVHESVHHLVSPAAIAAGAMVMLVLIVTCTNLANLMLARGAARLSEFAVRFALGGSRWRIVREQLIESALVAVVAGVGAVALAQIALLWIAGTAVRIGPGVQMQLTPEMNSALVVAGFVITFLSFMVFGVVPTLQLTRRGLARGLAANDGVGAAPGWRARRTLIAAQVTVSVALVATALFSVQHMVRAAQHDTGLELDRYAAVLLNFELSGYDEARAREVLRQALDAVSRELPIDRVALTSGLPLGLFAPSAMVARQGIQRRALSMTVTPEIFDVLGLNIVRGRGFTDRDTDAQQPVTVIADRTARQLFGDLDPIGHEVLVDPVPIAGEMRAQPVMRTVVGVVSDTDVRAPGRRERGSIYVPFTQQYEPRGMAIVAGGANPEQLAAALPGLVQRVDGGVAVSDVGTGVSLAGVSSIVVQVSAALTGTLGLVALMLAMTGLYGVLSYIVAGRRREIGVRRALGATTILVQRMVVLDGLRPILSGLLAGLALGGALRFAAGRLVRGLPPVDPWLAVAVPLLFIAAGLIACYLPARRASEVEPSVALREP
jgi:predicted permease